MAAGAGAQTPPNPILFVTQMPISDEPFTIGTIFGNHLPNTFSVGRGGDLYIRYPDGSLRNLTQEAGFGTQDGSSGVGSAESMTADTGYFWFFSKDHVEMVVKILDACNSVNRFWVFAGGLTNVQVTMTVVDTENGFTKTYINPMGTSFQPIQDTNAFTTCP